MDMTLSKLQEMVKDREAWYAASMGLQGAGTTEQLNNNNVQRVSMGAVMSDSLRP